MLARTIPKKFKIASRARAPWRRSPHSSPGPGKPECVELFGTVSLSQRGDSWAAESGSSALPTAETARGDKSMAEKRGQIEIG